MHVNNYAQEKTFNLFVHYKRVKKPYTVNKVHCGGLYTYSRTIVGK